MSASVVHGPPRCLSSASYYRAAIEYDTIPELERVIPPELERLRRGLLEPVAERRLQSAAEAMQCLSEWPGHRFAKLLLARIYETAIGTRSSGFTDAHEVAPPSFLLRQNAEPQIAVAPDGDDDTVLVQRPVVREGLSVAPDTEDIDEDAKTMLRRPWLSRARWMTKLRVPPERQQPERMKAPAVIARAHDQSIGPHPVAAAPPREPPSPTPTRRMANVDVTKARAVTPTLRFVMSLGDSESEPPRRHQDDTDPLSFGSERDASRQSALASGSIEPSAPKSSCKVIVAEASVPESGLRSSPRAPSTLHRFEARRFRLLALALLVTRIGETHQCRVDIRVVAATNRDLVQMVAEGKFREDLFFRLAKARVELPPLREREDDAVFLAEQFLEEVARERGAPLRLSDKARSTLASYRWPGNVRELRHAIERDAYMADHTEIDIEIMPTVGSKSLLDRLGELGYQEAHDELDRTYLARVMEKTNGKIQPAANMIGIDRGTLRSRLKELGLYSLS